MYDKYNILCCLFASGYRKGYNMDMKNNNYSLYERIILKLHKRLFTKIYHKIRIEIVNNILK